VQSPGDEMVPRADVFSRGCGCRTAWWPLLLAPVV
jgi:hypothetical protein